MSLVREKFSSQADPHLLAQVRELAEKQGRQFQSVLEQALTEYLERTQKERPRTHVLEAFGMSMEEFDDLYKKLAK
ncbi:hypothetical protein GALL_488420 [mine drainage metagenome]|uniref:Ribbon-helix-helix protein CopG domain-containing protein n=1 Tax=mine drainage metagenome TaxID=410659 RepID=A0A1J5PD37_9ZZZZ